MRLFMAIPLKEGLLEAALALQRRWQALGLAGHYTPPENLHLTTLFIGEYGEAEAVTEVADRVKFSPFCLNLDGIGEFNDTYWGGVEAENELFAYVKRLRRALAEADIPFDRKRFVPHITLVRKAAYEGVREELWREVPQGGMTVCEMVLFSSQRGKNGMIYTPMAAFSADLG